MKKRDKTNLDKFGETSYLKTKEGKQRVQNTNFKRYGTKVPAQNPEILKKIENTNLKRYGYKSPFSNKKIQQKTQETVLKLYGTKNVFQNKEIKEKIIKTNLEKYGVNHYSKTNQFKQQIKNTNQKNYGLNHSFQNEEIKEKIIKTNLEKYGHKYIGQVDIFKQKSKETCLKQYGQFPVNNFGKTQNEIQEYLNSFSYNFFPNYSILEGKEIDLYDDNLKIGIEYCGLYWHTENSPEPRDKTYHYNKYKQCLNNNIKLITLFEDEWLNRQDQIKIYLKQLLNINLNKISINDCKIKQINKIELNEFLELYSIEGKTESIVSFGIFYNNKLIGVINIKLYNNCLLLNRIEFKEDIFIENGRKELFNKCIEYIKTNNYKEIYCITDNRWITNNIEPEYLGFELIGELEPDYSYVNIKSGKKRLLKENSKKILSNKLDNISEQEYMLELDYSRIWDCGRKIWLHNI